LSFISKRKLKEKWKKTIKFYQQLLREGTEISARKKINPWAANLVVIFYRAYGRIRRIGSFLGYLEKKDNDLYFH